jgi:putative ABC transport system permease protein
LAGIAGDLERTYHADNNGRGVNVEPLTDVIFGPIRPAFLALLGGVGLVLLVACANVANLLLAKGTARRREIAVRAALGAGSWRIARQFLTEAVALSLTAALAGVAIAYVVVRWLVAQGPASIPRLASASIDLRVLGVTLLISIAAGLLFGVFPALQARRAASASALGAESGRTHSGGRDQRRLRTALVVTELALATALVCGAGLLIKSFWRLYQTDPGFRSAGVYKAEYQLPSSRYPANFAVWPNFKEMHAFTAALLDRVKALPGVDASAIAGNHPLDPGFTTSFVIVGREAESANQPEMSIRRVTPGYFETVGMTLVSGRLLTDGDTAASAPVLVVNQATVDRFFPGRDPLGQQIRFWGAPRRIVGVVRNEKFQGLESASPPAVYAPLLQAPSANGSGVLLVRTRSGDTTSLATSLGRAIRDVDPGLAVFAEEALDDTVTRSTAERRFTMILLGIFAAMALGLAALGIHSVLSYSVSQRTREIGIRLALGASPGRLRGLVVRDGLVAAGIGLGLGLAGALALGSVLRKLLFGVSPADVWTFAAVAAVLLVVAAAASYLPARRVSKIDPNEALRETGI